MPELTSWLIAAMAGYITGTIVGYLKESSRERGKRAAERRPSVEIVEVSLSPGAPFSKWCEDCNRTHLWVTIYAYEGDDPTTARPIGVAPIADDESQDGER